MPDPVPMATLAGCRMWEAGAAVQLNSVTLRLHVNINTDVSYVVPASWTRRETQVVSIDQEFTMSRVEFTALDLLRYRRNGGDTAYEVFPDPSTRTPFDAHTYALLRLCRRITPILVYEDAPGVFWSNGTGILKGFEAQHLNDSFDFTAANDAHKIYSDPAMGVTPPDDTDDTDDYDCSVGFLLLLPVLFGDTHDVQAAVFTLSADGSGLFTAVSDDTDSVPVNLTTLARKADDDPDIGGEVTYSKPAPSGAGVTVNAWTYDVTITATAA